MDGRGELSREMNDFMQIAGRARGNESFVGSGIAPSKNREPLIQARFRQEEALNCLLLLLFFYFYFPRLQNHQCKPTER